MKSPSVSSISSEIPIPKKSKFNLSHDVNTSYDWGSVQPLFSKLMLPDSSINVNLEQLTRLAPMPVPTFGRVRLKNIAHFVKCQDIFPNWQALLSKTKVTRSYSNGTQATSSTYVPQFVPCIPNSILAAFCLTGCKMNVYFSGDVGTIYENNWYCARNTGTWNTPAGWTQATSAVRDLLDWVVSVLKTNTPPTSTIAPFHYTGYSFQFRRLLRAPTAGLLLSATGAPVCRIPTISTQVSVPLANANGSGYTHSASNEQNSYDSTIGDEHISFDGADLIWEYKGSNGLYISSADRAGSSGEPVEGLTDTFFDGKKIRFTFKFSSFGKRLRKILIGLGYDVNLDNSDMVSILPLVAYYKAWWDSFAPERYKNFYETACWKLINASMADASSAYLLNSLNTATNTPICDFFREFMADLGTCFATERLDVVSSATDQYYRQDDTTQSGGNPAIEMSVISLINSIVSEPSVGTSNADGSRGVNPYPAVAANTGAQTQVTLKIDGSDVGLRLSQPQIDSLKAGYIMLNKCSVAGMRVEQILRALGFGDYVEECKGKYINGSSDAIKISDVVSTSATADAQLGQYGGRGLGVGDFQFSFEAKSHGYLIVLSCIVPESGYINAPVHENKVISFDTLYNPEMDGMAYEALQRNCLLGSPLINDFTYKNTFGYVPTYTRWKFMSNKANGDFSLNSQKKSIRSYTLDKYIPVSDVGVYRVEEVNGHAGSTLELCNPTFTYQDLPNAGEDYRYVNKFPWNGDYNRIFTAEGDGLEWSVFSPNDNAFLYLSFEFDNFLTHNVFNVSYWAHMKPLEDSYGTYDKEHGAPNSSIKKA